MWWNLKALLSYKKNTCNLFTLGFCSWNNIKGWPIPISKLQKSNILKIFADSKSYVAGNVIRLGWGMNIFWNWTKNVFFVLRFNPLPHNHKFLEPWERDLIIMGTAESFSNQKLLLFQNVFSPIKKGFRHLTHTWIHAYKYFHSLRSYVWFTAPSLPSRVAQWIVYLTWLWCRIKTVLRLSFLHFLASHLWCM